MKTSIKILGTLLLFALTALTAQADEKTDTATFTLTKEAWTHDQSLDGVSTVRDKVITLSFSKGSGTSVPLYTASSKTATDNIAKLSVGNSLTLSSTSKVITAVTFKFTAKSKAATVTGTTANYTISCGSYTGASPYNWTGNATELTLTNTSNKGGFEITAIIVYYESPSVTYDEAATPTITTATGVNVQLKRTLSADYWNTFCVPFSISDANSLGTVYQFDKFANNCYKFKKVSTIEAGVPYLVKPATTITDPIFTGVDITATTPQTLTSEGYSMVGTFGPYTMATDGTEQFLGDNDLLYIPAATTNQMPGMRAYFKFPEQQSSAKIQVVFDGNGTTGISTVSTSRTATHAKGVYTLQGVYMGTSTRGLQPGMYVVDGRKVTVRP